METKSPKNLDSEDTYSVVDRLINEVRQYKNKLNLIRVILSSTGKDHERLSILGAIDNLIRENKELRAEVKALNKELDTLIRKSR